MHNANSHILLFNERFSSSCRMNNRNPALFDYTAGAVRCFAGW